MQIVYGKAWVRGENVVIEVWDAEHARSAHEKRKPYVAAVRDEQGRFQAVVEVNNDYFGVEFLDGVQRGDLSYQFVEERPGLLFLGMAVWREFEGDSDDLRTATIYHFNSDGSLVIEKEVYGPGARSLEARQDGFDVSGNWERYPQFGVYDSLLRRER